MYGSGSGDSSLFVDSPVDIKACRGGMAREGRRRQLMREGSIKFLVAPQSMRAVVVMVLALYHNLIGNRKAHLDLLATISEAILREEEDVTTSSCSKKTAPQFRWHLLLRSLCNQISSSAHSGVVQRHLELLNTWLFC